MALGAWPVVIVAADTEALDAAFLEYLAEFEGTDDWSWFDSDERVTKSKSPTKTQAPAKSVDASPSAANPEKSKP